MTPERRQELANRAHSLAVQIECLPACEPLILKALEKVERETCHEARLVAHAALKEGT